MAIIDARSTVYQVMTVRPEWFMFPGDTNIRDLTKESMLTSRIRLISEMSGTVIEEVMKLAK